MRYTFRGQFQQYGHDTAEQVRMRDPRHFETCWKYGFVRNPWDRYCSLYYHFINSRHEEMRADDLDWQRESFHEWIHTPYVRKKGRGWEWTMNQCPNIMFHIDGEMVMDKVFRFDRLHDAYRQVADKLQAPLPNLPTRKAAPKHFRTKDLIVDPEDIEFIAHHSAWEIERFGYRYEQASR